MQIVFGTDDRIELKKMLKEEILSLRGEYSFTNKRMNVKISSLMKKLGLTHENNPNTQIKLYKAHQEYLAWLRTLKPTAI